MLGPIVTLVVLECVSMNPITSRPDREYASTYHGDFTIRRVFVPLLVRYDFLLPNPNAKLTASVKLSSHISDFATLLDKETFVMRTALHRNI
jgi:hypothetical protein